MSTPKGMVARRHQDPKNSSVTLVEYVRIQEGKPHGAVVKCSTCGKPFTLHSMEIPESPVCKDCQMKLERAKLAEEKKLHDEEIASRVYRTCKGCGRRFYIPGHKVKKLQDAGMELFTHCFECQLKRDKAKKEAKE